MLGSCIQERWRSQDITSISPNVDDYRWSENLLLWSCDRSCHFTQAWGFFLSINGLKNTQWGRASPTYIKSFLFTLFFCPQAAGAGRSVSQRKRGGQQPSRAAKTGMVMRVQLWLLSAVIIKVKPTKKSIRTVLHTDVAAVCIFQYWYLLWADLQKIPNKKIMMVFSDQMWSKVHLTGISRQFCNSQILLSRRKNRYLGLHNRHICTVCTVVRRDTFFRALSLNAVFWGLSFHQLLMINSTWMACSCI